MGLRNVLKNQRLAKSISFFCIMSMLIGMSNLIFSNVLAADSYEPDNTPATASSISVDGTLQSHTFDPVGDEDWLIFTAIVDKIYIIDTSNYGDSWPYLHLYDTDGTTLIKTDTFQLDWLAIRNDDFYVKVTNLFSEGGPSYSYDINISESDPPPPDAYEPDNSPAEATSTPVDGTVQSHNFNVPDDEDWLIFSTTIDMMYHVTTFNLGDTWTWLQIKDTDGTTTLESNIFELEWQAPRSDDFYVRVYEYWDNWGASYTYDINISESEPPPGDVYEPDDTYSEASTILVDGSMQTHSFHIDGDEDWVVFSALENYLYTIETHNLNYVDTIIYLYDSDGTTILRSDDDGGAGLASKIEWAAPRDDDFYVKIIEFGGSGGQDYTYDVNVIETEPPPPDSYEPDDTYQEANYIPIDGTSQSHTFHIADDEDWLYFSATEGNLYEIFTENLGDPVPLILIFDSDGTSYLDGGLYDASFTAPSTDNFYLSVTEYYGNSGHSYYYDIYIIETAPPSAPNNFLTASGLGYVNLTWEVPSSDGGAPITSYHIYRNNTAGQETFYEYIGNQFYFNDTDVTTGVTYYYSVCAVNIAGEGTKTDEIQATPATYPTEPGNLETLVGDQFINLSWLAPQSDGGLPIIKYNIYRGEDPEQKTLLEVDFGNLTYYNDTGLTNGVVYFYNISAINGVGEGPLSSEINATPVTVPSKPRNLEMSSGDSYVNLSWKEPSSDGGTPITNYIIFKSKTSGELEFLKEIDDLRYYNDTKVTNGETYYYQVCAVNDVDEGERTQEMQTNPLTTPTQPRNIQDFFGDSYVLLTWSVPISSGGSPITNYVIYRRTSSHGDTLRTEIGNVTEYNDTSVTNGVTYYYNISAKNDKGEGLLSNQVTVKPYTIPSEPKYLIVQAENDYINLSWDEPDEDGGSPVTAYVIYRGTVQGEEEYLKEIDNITFYDDDDIEGDKTYYYKVCAINDAGTGLHSEGISITSNAEEGELPMLWIILIVVIVIILASAVGAMTGRSKKKKRSQEQPQMTAFESQPEWEQPAQTFTMEPEPEPVFEPQAFAPTPVPAMTPSQLIRATYKCPNCTRMFTTENPIQATVVSCPACNKQTIILPQ